MFNLWNLTFEVTRRCNLKCKHCMRGNAQNVDLTKEIVDQVLDNNDIKSIDHLAFSGGEPTLNEDIIVYIIDKIIANNIDVYKVSMVTNGVIFSEKIIDAFKRFNKYRNEVMKERLTIKYSHHLELLPEVLKENTDTHARIGFSNDQFHGNMEDTIKKYKEAAPELKFSFNGNMKDEDLYKTGRSKIGREFTYAIDPIRYYEEGDCYNTFDYLYVTSLGYYETKGMGSFEDMDMINMGSVFDISIKDILVKHGEPFIHTTPIQKKLALK